MGAEKAFDKIQHSFLLKILEIIRINRPFLNIVNGIYLNTRANIYNGVKLEAFPLRSRIEKGCQLSLLFNLVLNCKR